MLQRILVGRITFTLRRNEVSDEIDGYDFEAPTRFDGLFTGIAVERPKNLDPMDLAGTEDIGPEDTLDGEYSRLLERAYSGGNHVKGLASLVVATSNQLSDLVRQLAGLQQTGIGPLLEELDLTRM